MKCLCVILSCVPCLHSTMFFHTLSQTAGIWDTSHWTQILFSFCPQISSEIFLIPKRIDRDFIINVLRSAFEVPVVLIKFQWKLNFLYMFLKKKYRVVRYYENSSSESRVVPCGRTDRHDEINILFSQFCYRVWWLWSLKSWKNTVESRYFWGTIAFFVFIYGLFHDALKYVGL
jgi:hypothetical protein